MLNTPAPLIVQWFGAPGSPYGQFGPGQDRVAWLALGLAFVCAALARSKRFRALRWPATRLVLAALSLTALTLSAAYVQHYLRGGPRIIDATSYLLQARALARGYFAFPVPEPELAFIGRFLLSAPESNHLGVLFPPGYPAALSLFALLGAPLALGPVLAALLVPVTYWVTRRIGGSPHAALVAAGLSVLAAALRYHTADTMSHGLCALLVTSSFALATLGRTRTTLVSLLLAGFLLATRPVTFAALFLVLCWLHQQALRRFVFALPALLPGLLLLLLHQHAVTGSWFQSTQLSYYSLADGPPGCFRYGFGAGIGCIYEHGDFVRARLQDGYGVSAALSNTLRRLWIHAMDVTNVAPLLLLLPLGAWQLRAHPSARAALAVWLLVVLGYAPFYFDASYPGGGARLFADALPLAQALVAVGLERLRLGHVAPALALFGFALHTQHQHRALAERDGGRPAFEPHVLRSQGVDRGLLFVGSDAAFNLAHRPGQLSTTDGLVVARRRNDAVDQLLWEHLGKPRVYLYRSNDHHGSPELVLLSAVDLAQPSHPATPARTLRIEAEQLWPAIAVRDTWVHPDFHAAACVSKGRGLRLHVTPPPISSTGASSACVTLALPPLSQWTELSLGWVGPGNPQVGLEQGPLTTLRWHENEAGCRTSQSSLRVAPGTAAIRLCNSSGLLDDFELLEVSTKPPAGL